MKETWNKFLEYLAMWIVIIAFAWPEILVVALIGLGGFLFHYL